LTYPRVIHEAMRYSVFSGGKRIRPILCLASCEICRGREIDALPTACGLELIHCYSLIHDDLPCMDDDDVRRGKPATHRKFGEAMAILAGNGLLTFAFNLMTRGTHSQRQNTIVKEVTQAIGTFGMIGGQVVDLTRSNCLTKVSCRQTRNNGNEPARLGYGTCPEYSFSKAQSDPNAEIYDTMNYINMHKTGALMGVSMKAGAILAEGSKSTTELLSRIGQCLGMAYQIRDDILDNDGSARLLGKSYAKSNIEMLTRDIYKNLRNLGAKREILYQIAGFLLDTTGSPG